MERDTWGEYRRLVLAELERGDEERKALDDRLKKAEAGLLTIQVKAGVWGAIAGFCITIIVSLIVKYLGG